MVAGPWQTGRREATVLDDRQPEAPTGVIRHFRRLALNFASPRGVRSLAREASSLLTHVVRYPLGFSGAPVTAHRGIDGDAFEVPVVMVHGYFHNRSGFIHLSREMHERGFRWVHGMNYNPLRSDVPALAERFANHVEDVLKVSGADRVHVVGHSLGGVIARWFVEHLKGHEVVDHCVTIGTPHQGTVAAYIGFGPAARDMRPGSDVVRRLALTIRRPKVKYVNLYSDLDFLIVPSFSGVLPDHPDIHNFLIEDLGHTSLLVSDELIKQLGDHLVEASDDRPIAEVRELRRRA